MAMRSRAAFLLFCPLAITSFAQSPTFGLYNLEVPGSPAPAAVVAADFNGDKKIDLAVATQSGSQPNTVLIYLGNGGGTFQQPKSYVVGSFVFAMISGDFNGDGKVDLATCNGFSKDISVLLGNGDGTFQTAVSYPVGGVPGGLVAADLNGDGKVDIAVSANSDPATAALMVLLGKGDGTFLPALPLSFGKLLTGIAAGDLNGDGKLDLAIRGDGILWLLLGHGDGTFATPHSISIGGASGNGIVVADFNGDKVLDLAVNNLGAGGVSVLLGNGDGTFKVPRAFTAGRAPIAIAVGDLNGDGKLDMAVANNGEPALQSGVSVLFGNGDGTFGTAIPLAAGGNPFSVAVADLNGDGKLDLAVANNGSSYVSLLMNGAPKGLSSFTTVSAASSSAGLAPESLVAAYGVGVAPFDLTADLLPLPTILAGLTLDVQDSAGAVRMAPLLFVSPGQINFEIPAGTAVGTATLTIVNGTAAAMIEAVKISRIAPGIFTANPDGKGVPAAQVLRVSGGKQTFEAAFQPGAMAGTYDPKPIDLSTGNVYLLLFGTGIRGLSGGLSAVKVKVNGEDVPVLFAGAQPTFVGLDQVNIGPFPSSLAGKGTVNLVMTVEGQAANTVTIAFR